MPTEAAPQLTAWSYSRWRDYNKCPLYAKYKYIDKLPEPDSPAMARGTEIHKIAEEWVTSKRRPRVPKELERFTQEFLTLRHMSPVLAEQQWAFGESWNPVDWFAHDVRCRIKVDVWAKKLQKMGLVIDHKTGKPKDFYKEQLSLYAIGAFSIAPEIVAVNTQLWYLDAGKLEDQLFTRGQLDELKADWQRKTKAMLNDRTFAPRPSEACKWCAYSKTKGGPCGY